jgi:hypothetical protein
MAATVYSKRFFQGSIPTTGITAFTVPPGQTLVLRDLEVYNPDSLVAHLNVVVGLPGSQTTALFIEAQPGLTTQWQGRVVLNENEDIVLAASSATTQAVLSGYLLG